MIAKYKRKIKETSSILPLFFFLPPPPPPKKCFMTFTLAVFISLRCIQSALKAHAISET
jgi:hypothetical protein